jgi:hypothetical protein
MLKKRERARRTRHPPIIRIRPFQFYLLKGVFQELCANLKHSSASGQVNQTVPSCFVAASIPQPVEYKI